MKHLTIVLVLICLATPLAKAGDSTNAGESTMVMAIVPKPAKPERQRFLTMEMLTYQSANAAVQITDLIQTMNRCTGKPRIYAMPQQGPTQEFITIAPNKEINPIARVFVNAGWGPATLYFIGGGVGGPLYGSYWLRKHGHPRLAKALPITTSALGSFMIGYSRLHTPGAPAGAVRIQ
jgi:hypothetical protein